jgi:hypothetical protein
MFYMLLKLQGKQISNHPVIAKLIYFKTLIGKLKPIDKKLEYQISKMIRIATRDVPQTPVANDGDGELNGEEGDGIVIDDEKIQDPLLLHPRPHDLDKELTTDVPTLVQGLSGRAGAGEGVEKYKAPKISATLSKDEKLMRRKERIEQKDKKKMARSEFFGDMQDEFSERPREVRDYTNEEVDIPVFTGLCGCCSGLWMILTGKGWSMKRIIS